MIEEAESGGALEPLQRDDELALDSLLDFLRRERGFDFSGYKRASLTRRVRQRMASVGVRSLSEYVAHVQQRAGELPALSDALLINVTRFFRDPLAWRALEALLPTILARDPGAAVRVWSAGCSSGEESYSLAMLLREALGAESFARRVKIFATDVDEDALAAARLATYPREALSDVPRELVEKYFSPSGDRMVLASELRSSVVFGRHDLLRDAPIRQVDVLVCRNVLIYLEVPTQERVLESFRFALRPGGVLLLGRAEMLLTRTRLFTPIDLKQRLFSPESRAGDHVPVATLEQAREAGAKPRQVHFRRLRHRLRRANAELESARGAVRTAREQLRATMQMLHAANEDLETTNEELEATNQELQTTSEELGATNEELQTLNEELRKRGAELGTTTALLNAVLANLRCGIAVLDRDLRVQIWSSWMARLSGVAADDALGRTVLDLVGASSRSSPLTVVAAALREIPAIDGEVVRTLDDPSRPGDKTAYEVRLAPLVGGPRTNGGVLVFVGEVD